ncbi:MAG: DUF6079 family protein [Bacillota bacterium]
MKIKDLVELKSFQPVINLKWADNKEEQEDLLENYILTEDLAELFTEILETINMKRSQERCDKLGGDINPVDTLRSHVIRGQYGTGKSYFLLMLSIILETNNRTQQKQLLEKVKSFPELHYQLKYIIDQQQYMVVRINGEDQNEKRFDDMIQEAVIKKLNQEFDDLVLKSNYQNLLDNLKTHREHELRGQILKEAFAQKNYSYQDLVAALKGHQRDAQEKYEELMREAGLNSGDDFKNLTEFMNDIDRFLKSKGYDELIIILDEFSAYLDASVEARRSKIDLGNIQTLAQATAPTSKHNISFVTSTHIDMRDILNQAFTNQDDVNKVLGRFKQRIISFNQGSELIKDTIQVVDNEFKQLKEEHLAAISNLEQKYELEVEDYYPLHPATVTYLQPVASQFAQKDRTLFMFLKEVVQEEYFYQEIKKEDKLNLIGLDDIFNYFSDEFTEDRNLVKVYNQMKEIASSELEIKITKALIISYISLLSGGSGREQTAGLAVEDLQYIYLEDQSQIANALDNLAEDNRSHLIFNDGKYQLVISNTGINIEQKISQVAKDINPDRQLRTLLEEEESSIDIKKEYNLKYNLGIFPLDRELEGQLISVDNFLAVDNLQRYFRTSKDGKLVFIIPKFNERYDLEELKLKYQSKFKSLPKNTALALPKEIYFSAEDLKKYGAIKYLENDEEIVNNDDLEKLLLQRKRKVEAKIRNGYLRKFGRVDNFEFIFGGGIVRENLRNDKELFKKLLYDYYYKFPLEINVENFNSRSASNKVIKRMIASGEAKVSKSSNSVFRKQIFNTMQPLDLVKIEELPENHEVKLKKPERKNSERSYEIWEIITDTQMSINDKFETLENPPYGLNEQLVELYIAVVLGLGKFRLKSSSGKVITAPNKDHIAHIKDSNYEMEEVPDTGVEKKERVKEVWEILAQKELIPNSQYRKFDPHGRSQDNKFFSIIGSELKAAVDKLDTYQEVLNSKGLEIEQLELLKNELLKTTQSMSPEQQYNNLINLVDNYNSDKDYYATLKEIEDLLDNLLTFMNQKDKINKLATEFNKLSGKINILQNYSQLKGKLQSVRQIWQEYQANPFDFDLLSALEDNLELAIAAYNQTYKEAHDDFYQRFVRAKQEILDEEGERIEVIKLFEKINFSNITKIKDNIERLTNFQKCDNLSVDKDRVAECNCAVGSLKIVENKSSDIEQLQTNETQKIANIYTHYIDRLNSESENFIEYLQQQDIDQLDEWKFILAAINDDATAYKKKLEEKLEVIAPNFNNYLKEGIEPEPDLIELDKFIKEFESEIEAYGLDNLTFDKVEGIFNKVCNKLATAEDYEGLKLGE